VKTEVRFLGALQICAGVFSLVTLHPAASTRGLPGEAALLAACALSIVAGALLWRGEPLGWRLTIANQAAQLVGVNSPLATFSVIHCVSLTGTFSCVAKATFSDSMFTTGITARVLHSVCDIGPGSGFAGASTYGISLNLVALAILLYAAGFGNRNKQPHELDPSPVATPV
jgi:hypothetical protein